MCALVFIVLPELDIVRGVLFLSATSLIPAICKVVFGKPPSEEAPRLDNKPEEEGEQTQHAIIAQNKSCLSDGGWRKLWYIGNASAALVQLAAIVALSCGGFGINDFQTSLNGFLNGRYYRLLPSPWLMRRWWVIPLALVFVSLTWWENFVEKNLKIFGGLTIPLKSWKVRLHTLKQKGCIISSLWNAGVIIAFPFIVFPDFMFKIDVPNQNKRAKSDILMQFSVPLAQGLASLFAFLSGSLACKLCMQQVAYSLPLLLSAPMTVVVLVLQCQYGFIPLITEYFWFCPEGFNASALDSTSIWQYSLFVLWWVSQMMIAGHIWRPRQNNMDRTEK